MIIMGEIYIIIIGANQTENFDYPQSAVNYNPLATHSNGNCQCHSGFTYNYYANACIHIVPCDGCPELTNEFCKLLF